MERDHAEQKYKHTKQFCSQYNEVMNSKPKEQQRQIQTIATQKWCRPPRKTLAKYCSCHASSCVTTYLRHEHWWQRVFPVTFFAINLFVVPETLDTFSRD
jgi:hypothetical protein